jgi:gluconokinase
VSQSREQADERNLKQLSPAPSVLVVMGVSGSGKTTVGALLASRLGWTFVDGDAFHPPSNVQKMQSGIALMDEDRWPWLHAIANWIDATRTAHQRGVVACSALKRSYRELLSGGRSDVRLVYLQASFDTVRERLSKREGHFMPVSLLQSQYETLEEPGPEEAPIIVSVSDAPETIVADVVTRLNLTPLR